MKNENLNFKIIIISIVTVIFLVYVSGRITYAISNTMKINSSNKVASIKSIKDIKQDFCSNSVYIYKKYGTINAEFSDGSHKKVPIIWSIGPDKLNKGHIVYLTYYGSVKGYNRKVKLTVIFK